MKKTIVPPAVIGILGGGQLGRMMALEAKAMGYRVVTLDPTNDSPCGQVADQQIIADFDDLRAAESLGKIADIVTYEFENVSSDVAKIIQRNSYLPQGYSLLYTTQNRLREKRAVEQAGCKVAPYVEIKSLNDFQQGIVSLGLPAVIKTVEGGYDGKGQKVLKTSGDALKVQNELDFNDGIYILEKFIPYVMEFSVIIARRPSGEQKAFPVVENIHRDNILHMSIAPARVCKEIAIEAENIARKIAEHLNLVGLLAIEMFLQENGEIFVNELAPRPHNSGHFTQQGCLTSQFEQHIRAVCNLPLGDPEIIRPTVMVNILGKDLPLVLKAMPSMDPRIKVHIYGKAEARSLRKMGHLNVVTDSLEESIRLIKELGLG